MIKHDLLHITIFFVNREDLIDYAQQISLQKIYRMIVINSNNSHRHSIKEIAPQICAIVPLFE